MNVHVIRDDYLVGGTKQRALAPMLLNNSSREFVYAGPVYGFAQIALAYCATMLGKKGTVVLSEQPSGKLHPLTRYAKFHGASIVQACFLLFDCNGNCLC